MSDASVRIQYGSDGFPLFWVGEVDGHPFRFKYTASKATAETLRDEALRRSLRQGAAWQAIADRLSK